MLEEQLLNYGAMGLFCAYLIYHDRTVNVQLVRTLQDISDKLRKVECDVKELKRQKRTRKTR